MDKKSQNLNFFVLKMIRYASGSFYVKIQMSHFCDIEALRSMNVLLPHFSFILCRYLISGSPCRELWSYRGFRWSDINAYFMDNTRPWRNIKVHQFSKISILSWRQIIFPIKESRRQLLLYFTKKRYCIYVLSMRQREEIEDQLYQWSCDATIRILRIWWIRKISFFSSRFWEEEEMFSCNGSRLMAYEQFKLISDLLPSLLFLLPSGIIASFMYFLFASFSDVTFCELQVLLFQVGLLRSI